MGVIAIAVFARRIGADSAIGADAAVGAVMTARVLPGFVMGPLGGVLADRWDRKRAMVGADVLRAVIIFSVPFVPNLLYLLLASALLESLTLIWGPAKDASLPNFVPAQHLTHANALSLIAIYGPLPLATVLFASLAAVGGFLGENVPVLSGLRQGNEALALWADSLTFAFSAIMISTLAIASSRRRAAKFELAEVGRDLVEGLRFVRDHRQVRPWLLGIAFTFTAAGGVFSLGVGFVEDVLGGGETGFSFLIGFLGTGMIVGLLAAGLLAKLIQKDVLFSTSILLLGIGLVGLAAMGSLNPAIPIASALGFFGGVAYATGYSLIQQNTEDEIRGRTFSAGYTVIRIGILVGLGFFPFVAGAVGDHVLQFPGGEYPLPGTRITLWFAGAFVLGGGLLSMRAISHREKGPERRHGYFVVFEGGEGAGKSTQIQALVRWLEARGDRVVVTREPGGTSIGARIRELLLDPAASEMEPRAEALLYAADRAQHVAEIVSPALEQGAIVVSDRFVDSSLAYQGIARELGLEDIYNVSAWATGGLMPDLVFFLELDAKTGLGRAGESRDRIEREAAEFHDRVSDAYLELAERFPDRFVVLDGNRHPDEIHKEVRATFEERTAHLPTGVWPRGTVPR